MRFLTGSMLLLLSFVQPLSAQRIGEPESVDLIGSTTPLTLEFSDRDYLLILYSLETDVPPDLEDSPEYAFSVFSVATGAGSARFPDPGGTPIARSGGGPDDLLRRQEHDLARRVRQTGGYRPPAAKVSPHAISTRRFVFPALGNVTDTTITAALMAFGDRANVYVDLADTGRVDRARIQAEVDRFSTKTYPVVTAALGSESVAGGMGRIFLLYTHLVDEVGDDTTRVRGFFSAASVLPVNQGGNGNLANLLYINPFIDPDVSDAVLAHEFQHLINFRQHVLVRNGPAEESWLNEGLSHVCEDLIGDHEAHNRSNVERFLANPHGTPLRASVGDPGVRGAAYLFVRSLMEDFGPGILPRLVNTNRIGVANVKTASGDRVTDIYERYVSRLFLSGSGLNGALEFTTPFLADTTGGARLFPHPEEFLVSPGTSPAIGTVHPFSAAFVRLSYDGDRTIWIGTDPGSSPGVVLVPIPPRDRSRISIPADFFTGITLDAPVAGPFLSYEPIRVSGAVSDPAVTEIEFVLLFADYRTENRYVVPVRGGRFTHTFFFSHEQAGDYRLEVRTRRADPQDSAPAGTFNAFTVEEGPATAPIPAGYFTDIVLSSSIPVEAPSGEAIRLSGAVTDPSLTAIKFSFWHEDIDRSVHFNAPVIEGQFTKTVLFTHGQTGVYQVAINRRRGDTSYALPQDAFSPFVVRKGEGTVLIPVDFFEEIRLLAPMPVEYRIGLPVRVAGDISDPLVSQIEFEFFTFREDTETAPATTDTRFFAQVVDGRFSTDLAFSREQQVSDDYTLDVWLWRNGERSRGFRTFSPISIGAAPSPDFDGDGTVGFADFIAFAGAFGTSDTDVAFDARFDLDGDGTVGFGDFVIFARSFGG